MAKFDHHINHLGYLISDNSRASSYTFGTQIFLKCSTRGGGCLLKALRPISSLRDSFYSCYTFFFLWEHKINT